MDPSTTRRRQLLTGATFLLVVLALLVGVFYKQALLAMVRPGETIQAEFARAYKLDPAESAVKIAGSPVGVVRSVEPTERGTSLVTMRVDEDTRRLLGEAPTAMVRPTTILGGRYYVDLRPGGRPGAFLAERIPVERAKTPVELNEALEGLQPRAVEGMRGTLAQVDQTLRAGGSDALREFVTAAPAPLRSLGPVVASARGEQPEVDLARLVTDTDKAAGALLRRDGQLDGVLRSLDTATAALAERRGPLAEGVDRLPSALAAIDLAARRVSVTLDDLRDTAPRLHDTAAEFDPLMARLDPMLAELRPVTARLPGVLRDGRSLVHQLIPVSTLGRDVFDDLRGPVLDRINGPVNDMLRTEWKGTGRFAGGGDNGNNVYQQIAAMISNVANSTVQHDQNGSAINFELGEGPSMVNGMPFGLDNMTGRLDGIGGPPR
ncbi:hypothetical protein GCM10023321_14750 [Pseudonocardia eucalypti]|uniref:Mce/MlaD domain-containing protein n=1 Tax=Pseudonocardia eucalypti TaxID=648755 RepID=A0ABP9PPJ6_9PSEU|nr:phospholipid/cholesterol/gamma-HCH transport system substrate-binding protein [Pseudonocardia eucalypti]